jgi:hypothetical protein
VLAQAQFFVTLYFQKRYFTLFKTGIMGTISLEGMEFWWRHKLAELIVFVCTGFVVISLNIHSNNIIMKLFVL